MSNLNQERFEELLSDLVENALANDVRKDAVISSLGNILRDIREGVYDTP